MSDVPYILPSFQGKVEFEAMEDGQEDKITQRIIHAAVKSVFDRHLNVDDLDEIALAFNDGLSVEIGENVEASDYQKNLRTSARPRRCGRPHAPGDGR